MNTVELNLKKSFASDNNSGVLPEVMAAIASVNQGHTHAYGGDEITEQVMEIFKTVFGPSVRPFFVFNGTAANVLSLLALVEPWEAVIAASTSHLHMDECGAPEWVGGIKLLTVETQDGKLTKELIEPLLIRRGDQHYRQPRAISITQPTEVGTVYSLEEIDALVLFARQNGLRVHIDGSRLVNAAASLGVTLQDLTVARGVDVVSFGGTKNGLLGAEAVLIFGDDLARNFSFVRKQNMQLVSKMRFVAAQYIEYFKNDLWSKTAIHVCEMAKLLESEVRKIPGVHVTQKVQSNAVFALIPKRALQKIRDHYFFYVWDEKPKAVTDDSPAFADRAESLYEVRWMVSFDTTASDIRDFAKRIREAING